MKIILIIFLLLTFTGPIWIYFNGNIDFKMSYLHANRASSHLAPLPKDYSEAIIQVYGARAFNWRGIFSLHTWLVIKPKNATQYTIYQVLGWRSFNGLSLSVAEDIPDRIWFNQKPNIILDIRGPQAEQLIPKINETIKTYPYANQYLTWPGPNSNTFIAYVARNVPEMKLAIPSNALGKDFTGNHFFMKAPSNTGYQFSLYGCLGITLALKEGLEINLLGLVYGFSPYNLTIKLPGFGDINMYNIFFNK